jgi:hypothetical protein
VLAGAEPEQQEMVEEDHMPQEQSDDTDPPQEHQCMHISLNALNDNINSISILVNIGGKLARALVDTGSSSTFMDLQFALQTNCKILQDETRALAVEFFGLPPIFPPTTFTVHNEQFEHPFRILELPGYDIVLGCDWQAKHSPIGFDYQKRTLLLVKEGKKHLSIPACDTILQATEISTSEVDKLLASGAEGYVINVLSKDTQHTAQVPAEIDIIIQQFADVFETPTTLPPERQCDHQIPLQENAVPPNTRPYRVPHKHKDELERQIKELLQAKIIRPSTSPFASPIILVKKKDHSWRLCVDYRKLNALTVKNKFPIPIIEDLLDELHGATVFTKLDLRSGYHQIRMDPNDIAKTAFRTYSGHYEYMVMPFGLSNAPGTFQSLMNEVFAPHLRKFILVFLMISSFIAPIFLFMPSI